MKRSLPKGTAEASAILAITCRVFYGLMLDSPEVHNGAWLSAIAGAALALPTLSLARRLKRAAPGQSSAARLLLSGLLIVDAAETIECTAVSAGYVAFSHAAAWLLALPALVLALRAALSGGDALGYSALLLPRIALPLLLAVAAFQWRYYRFPWLSPAFGYGMPGVLRAGLRSAGWISMIGSAAIVLERSDDAEKRAASPLRIAGASAAAVSVLIVLRLAMTPSTAASAGDRLYQLDALLTNGRAPLYCQLPMIALWFGGMLNLVCFETFMAGSLIGTALDDRGGRLVNLSAVLVSGALAAFGVVTPQVANVISGYGWLPLTAFAATASVGKDGDDTCEAS